RLAPRVSAMLSSAAKRIDPAQARYRRWKKPAGLATLTAAGGAIAAFLRRRKKPPVTTASADTQRANGEVQSSPRAHATGPTQVPPRGSTAASQHSPPRAPAAVRHVLLAEDVVPGRQ